MSTLEEIDGNLNDLRTRWFEQEAQNWRQIDALETRVRSIQWMLFALALMILALTIMERHHHNCHTAMLKDNNKLNQAVGLRLQQVPYCKENR